MLEAAREACVAAIAAAAYLAELRVSHSPGAHARRRAARAAVCQTGAECHGDGLAFALVDDARAALFHARASVVASGTATVEAALIGNPFVVVYRVSPLTYAIAKRVVKVPHVAMANLIAGKRVVPELIQHDFTASNIVQQLKRLLPDGPARQSMMRSWGPFEARCVHSQPADRARRQEPWTGSCHCSEQLSVRPAEVAAQD